MQNDTTLLRQVVTDFLARVDAGKAEEVIATYDPAFLNIRVIDSGEFVNMNYNQMVDFWKMQTTGQTSGSFSHKAITTLSTTIHYVEILDNTAHVLMTRVKDLGNGPEPMFYNFIWTYKNEHWYLLREFVHQRTVPKFFK